MDSGSLYLYIIPPQFSYRSLKCRLNVRMAKRSKLHRMSNIYFEKEKCMNFGKKILFCAMVVSGSALLYSECDGDSAANSEATCNKERGDKKCNGSGDCCAGRQCNSFGYCEYCR